MDGGRRPGQELQRLEQTNSRRSSRPDGDLKSILGRKDRSPVLPVVGALHSEAQHKPGMEPMMGRCDIPVRRQCSVVYLLSVYLLV